MEKIISILLVIVLCMCGCSINNESSSKSKEDLFVEQAEKHLAQKYPELEYSLGDVQFGTMWDDPDDTIEVTIENGKYKGRTFQIRRKTSNNPDKELTDNYFKFLILDDYKKLVDSYLKKYFENYQYSAYADNEFGNEFTSASTFEDARKYKNFRGDILIIVKPTFSSIKEFQKIANVFLSDYKKEGVNTLVRIYYLKPGIFENTDIKSDKQMTKNIFQGYGYQQEISETVN